MRTGVLGFVLFAGAPALADTVIVPSNLDVDFRTTDWAMPVAVSSMSFAGIIAHAEPDGAMLSHSDEFGMGVITGSGSDLIENEE